MSETIRVSRELLERIAYIMQVDLAYLYKEEKELRALLSQPAEQHSDPIQSIATQLGITTFGDGLLTKIRETIDLLQSGAQNLNQFREITAEQYGHLAAATKLNEVLQSELNEKRETICRLLSELDAVPKWQAIETAPRDGTEVLLRKGGRVTSGGLCAWSDTESVFHGSTGEYLGIVVRDSGSHWGTWDGGFADGDDPTHWMPLPAAPKDGDV